MANRKSAIPYPTMNWEASDLQNEFEKFKQLATLWMIGEEVSTEVQYAKIVLMTGEIGRKRFNTFNLTAEQLKDPENLWKAFSNTLETSTSYRVARGTLYKDFKMQSKESANEFDVRLTRVLDDCKFPEAVRKHLRLDIFIHACRYYEVKKWCNKQSDTGADALTYEKALEKARAHETSIKDFQQMHADNPDLQTAISLSSIKAAVDAMQYRRGGTQSKRGKGRRQSRSPAYSPQRPQYEQQKQQKQKSKSQAPPSKDKPCNNCGYTRHVPADKCPAKGLTCDSCGKKNHFSSVCRSSSPQRNRNGSPTPCRSRRRDRSPTPKVRSPTDSLTVQPAMSHDMAEQFVKLSFHSVQNRGKSSPKTRIHVDYMDTIQRLDTDSDGKTTVMVNLDLKLPNRPGGRHTLRCKADMGAESNLLPISTYRKMFPDRSHEDGTPDLKYLSYAHMEFVMYDGSITECLGCTTLDVAVPGKPTQKCQFFLSPCHNNILIGHPTAANLGIYQLQVPNVAKPFNQTLLKTLDVNESTVQPSQTAPQAVSSLPDLKRRFPECFDTIGNFPGDYHITVDPNIAPVQHARRKAPIHLQDKIKAKLDDMEQLGVIVKVAEPTMWVNSMTYPLKPNGDIRMCLDPKDLNAAIIREHYKAPTLQEITHKLAGATVFSKLDAQNGFWSIHLDDDSSYATTFNTPFGRYRYLRLPFGLKCSQDIFQMRMDQITEGLPGVIAIHDDICVFGHTKAEHDRNLLGLMQRAIDTGLVFNSSKCSIAKSEIHFFGMKFTADGIQPDESKIQALIEMPAPENVQQLQSFLGGVNFFQSDIPHLSTQTAPLRALLKSNTEWDWNASTNAAFLRIKSLLTVALKRTRHYFDVNKPVTVQADASKYGLGAALLQEGNLIDFASKSLTDAEQRYANIERELLAIVFACERFHTYIYGKEFIAETDHKPLEMITQKNLMNAPPRLQRMLIRLQPYDMVVRYRPGKEMLLADCLSRLPSKANCEPIQLAVRIDHCAFSPSRLDSLRKDTAEDPILSVIYRFTQHGWPETRRRVPRIARRYWDFRDELSTDEGLLLKGARIVIPPHYRETALQVLHDGHLGITQMQQSARTAVYWPGIDADIEDFARRCTSCMKCKQYQKAEPMQPHEVPDRPWQKVGVDFFEYSGKKFICAVDYFSKYPFITEMHSTTAKCTIRALTEIFATEGAPEALMTDNGPPFNSAEFAAFAQSWNFTHTTSSPNFPQSNGQVERTVQTIKQLMARCSAEKKDWHIALLHHRAQPLSSKLPSPAEILHQRPARTALPQTNPGPIQLDYKAIKAELVRKQQKIKSSYDTRHSAHELQPLHLQQPVLFQNTDGSWHKGTVDHVGPEPRSYWILTTSGNKVRRNRRHLQALDYTQPASHCKDTSLKSILLSERHHSPCQKQVSFADTDSQINSPSRAVNSGRIPNTPCASPSSHAEVLHSYYALVDEEEASIAPPPSSPPARRTEAAPRAPTPSTTPVRRTEATVPSLPAQTSPEASPEAPHTARPAVSTSVDVQEGPATPQQRPRRRRKRTLYYDPYRAYKKRNNKRTKTEDD
jgi:hypothetical protein